MGRHQDKTDIHRARADEAQKVELLGWGLFSTAVAAAAMTYFGLPTGIIFMIAAVGLAAFVLIWVISQLQTASSGATTPELVPAQSPRLGGRVSERRAQRDQERVEIPAQTRTEALPVIPAPRPAAGQAPSNPFTAAVPRRTGFPVAMPAAFPVAKPAAPPVSAAAARDLRAPATRREARLRSQFGGVTAHHNSSGAGHGEARSPALQAARVYESSPEASSWTKAFGAPDTGPLPIQPYTASQSTVQTAQRPRGRRQMSHSRL